MAKNEKLSQQKNKKRFIEKSVERSELSLQMAKVSGKPIAKTDKKDRKKRKIGVTTIDFINVRGQLNFEEEAVINLIEMKIENNRIQNMFDKY